MRPHYLRTMTGGEVPPVILSVGISTGRRTTKIRGKKTRYVTCEAWRINAYDTTADGIDIADWRAGSDPLFLWANVHHFMSEHGITWLWTKGLRDLLVLCDWYGMLDCGEWTIGGRDQGQEIERAAGLTKHFRGYLIDSDPPSIVLAQHRTSGAVIQMVDVANFGIDSWEQLYHKESGCVYADGKCANDGASHARCASSRATLVGQWAVSWSRLMKENHWGPLRTSAASQAMSAFRSKCLDTLILIHDNREAKQLERDAYFPGRCEAWRIGFIDGPVYHLDVNQCYQAVTRDELIPARLKGIGAADTAKLRQMIELGWLCIADVTIETSKPDYPYRHDGNVVWPMGRFRTQLCGPELELALSSNRVAAVHKVAWYEGAHCLRRWSDEVYSMRTLAHKSGMSALSVGVKCCAVSLYGAFAKRARRWTTCSCRPSSAPYALWYGRECGRCGKPKGKVADGNGGHDPEGLAGLALTRWRSIGWKAEFESAPSEAVDTSAAIAAWVSSLARRHLLRLLNCAGMGQVYYSDTDSVWVSERGIDALSGNGWIVGGAPGRLKLVSSHQSVIIHGHKSYLAGTSGAHVGVPTGASVDEQGNAEWDSVEGIESAIRRNGKPCAIVIRRKRSVAGKYTGGNVMEDGRVTPLWIWKGST